MRTSLVVLLSLFVGAAHAMGVANARTMRGNTFGNRHLYGTGLTAQNSVVEIEQMQVVEKTPNEQIVIEEPDVAQPIAEEITPVESASDKLNAAIENVRATCGGLGAELSDLRVMAGIGSAVSAVGAVAAGAAMGTGIAKAKADDAAMKLTPWAEKWSELIKADTNTDFTTVTDREKSDFEKYVNNLQPKTNTDNQSQTYTKPDLQKYRQESEEGKRGKTMGNIRTGTLATSAATNIASAVLSGTNQVKGDFKDQINTCLQSVRVLSDVRMQARIDGTVSDVELSNAEKIIRTCEEWSTVDINSINKRALGATITSGIGAGMGIAGTATSAAANTDKMHLSGSDSERKINVASNVMAGGAAAASLTSSILNAAQIKAIKRAATVADECEGALN